MVAIRLMIYVGHLNVLVLIQPSPVHTRLFNFTLAIAR